MMRPLRGLIAAAGLAFLLGLLSTANASYIPTPIKSIQQGTVTYTGSGTGSATVTSVNMTSSVVYVDGWNTASGPNADGFTARIQLTGATTITLTGHGNVGTDQAVLHYHLLEFLPQFIKSVQQTTIAFTGATVTNTATVTAVTVAKSAVYFQGCKIDVNNAGSNLSAELPSSLSLTGTTTVSMTRLASGNDATCGVAVLEFR